MYFCYQTPITDLRSFVGKATHKLKKPTWPTPDSQNMVRYFGPTTDRKKGGIDYWSDEAYICKAKRAIRLGQNFERVIEANGSTISYDVANRYFNSDGSLMAKYELGLVDHSEKILANLNIGSRKSTVLDLLKGYCQIPVRLPGVDPRRTTLYNSRKRMKELYLRATTETSHFNTANKHWINIGEPVVVTKSVGDAYGTAIEGTRKIENSYFDTYGISLGFYRIPVSGSSIRCWMVNIYHPGREAYEIARSIRINLLRVNAETETVRQVLNAIEGSFLNLENDAKLRALVGRRLNKLTENLAKPERYKTDQKDILRLTLESVDQITTGRIEDLNNRYKDLVKSLEVLNELDATYILKNLEHIKEFSGNLIVGSKNIVVADKIESKDINVGDSINNN